MNKYRIHSSQISAKLSPRFGGTASISIRISKTIGLQIIFQCLCFLMSIEGVATPPDALSTVTTAVNTLTGTAPAAGPTQTPRKRTLFFDLMGPEKHPDFEESLMAYANAPKRKGSVTIVRINSRAELENPGPELLKQLSDMNLTENDKIAIEGHGFPGADFMMSDQSEEIYTTDSLATFIKRIVPANLKRVKVTALSCGSGLGKFKNPDDLDERTPSLSEHLRDALGKLHIQADIKGRNGLHGSQETGTTSVTPVHNAYKSQEVEDIKVMMDDLGYKYEALGQAITQLHHRSLTLPDPGKNRNALIDSNIQRRMDERAAIEDQIHHLGKKIEVIDRPKGDPLAIITYSHDSQQGRSSQYEAVLGEERQYSIGEMEYYLNAEKEEIQAKLQDALEGGDIATQQKLQHELTGVQETWDKLQRSKAALQAREAQTEQTKKAADEVLQSPAEPPTEARDLSEPPPQSLNAEASRAANQSDVDKPTLQPGDALDEIQTNVSQLNRTPAGSGSENLAPPRIDGAPQTLLTAPTERNPAARPADPPQMQENYTEATHARAQAQQTQRLENTANHEKTLGEGSSVHPPSEVEEFRPMAF